MNKFIRVCAAVTVLLSAGGITACQKQTEITPQELQKESQAAAAPAETAKTAETADTKPVEEVLNGAATDGIPDFEEETPASGVSVGGRVPASLSVSTVNSVYGSPYKGKLTDYKAPENAGESDYAEQLPFLSKEQTELFSRALFFAEALSLKPSDLTEHDEYLDSNLYFAEKFGQQFSYAYTGFTYKSFVNAMNSVFTEDFTEYLLSAADELSLPPVLDANGELVVQTGTRVSEVTYDTVTFAPEPGAVSDESITFTGTAKYENENVEGGAARIENNVSFTLEKDPQTDGAWRFSRFEIWK